MNIECVCTRIWITNTKQKVEKQRNGCKHSCLKDYRRDPEDRPEWDCSWETVMVSRREEATKFISVLLKNKKGFFKFTAHTFVKPLWFSWLCRFWRERIKFNFIHLKNPNHLLTSSFISMNIMCLDCKLRDIFYKYQIL